MLGSKPRMPKRARYPLFLAGLAVILVGGLAEGGRVPEGAVVATVLLGLAFLVASVLLK